MTGSLQNTIDFTYPRMVSDLLFSQGCPWTWILPLLPRPHVHTTMQWWTQTQGSLRAGQTLCQPWATVLALSRNFKISTVNYPESNKIKKYYHILPLENHRAHSKILEMYQGYGSPQNSLPISLNIWTLVGSTPLRLNSHKLYCFPLFLINTLLKLQFYFLLSFLQASLHRLRSLFMVGRVSPGAASL